MSACVSLLPPISAASSANPARNDSLDATVEPKSKALFILRTLTPGPPHRVFSAERRFGVVHKLNPLLLDHLLVGQHPYRPDIVACHSIRCCQFRVPSLFGPSNSCHSTSAEDTGQSN